VKAFRNISMAGKIVMCGDCFSAAPTESFAMEAVKNGALVVYAHMRENAGFPHLFPVLEAWMEGLTVGEAYQRQINALMALRGTSSDDLISHDVAANNSLLYVIIGDPTLQPLAKTTAAPPEPSPIEVHKIQASFEVNLPGPPFGVVVSRDQKWIFVSISGDGRTQHSGIAVMRNRDGQIELLRTVPMARSPSGIVLTHDGEMLIAAAQDYVVFFDTRRLENGDPSPAFQWVSDGPKAGSVYVNVTADDRTLFVSDESIHTITVIDLEKIRDLGRNSAANMQVINSPKGGSSAIVGRIPVGISPVALTFSNDGQWLFTTSEVAIPTWRWPRVLEREGAKSGEPKIPEGAVIVIDVAKARTDPANSVLARVPAGGSPVRLALSPDGSRLFVSARNSNAVMVFDTMELVRNPAHAEPLRIPVGTNPVPVILVNNGKLALVGNSNRYSANAAENSSLTVLDTSRIGTQENPVVGSVPCGAYPREFHLAPDGQTLYLTNFRSNTLQVIDVSRLATIINQ
jgi:DNA-binding beta-propeller fold protein YncE